MEDKTNNGRALTFDDKMFNLQRFSEKKRWQFRSLGEDFGTNCKRVTKKKDLKKHTWVSHKKGGVEEAHACASQTTRTFKTGEIRRFRRRCVNLKRFSFISSYLESWHAENKFANIDIKTNINKKILSTFIWSVCSSEMQQSLLWILCLSRLPSCNWVKNRILM